MQVLRRCVRPIGRAQWNRGFPQQTLSLAPSVESRWGLAHGVDAGHSPPWHDLLYGGGNCPEEHQGLGDVDAARSAPSPFTADS